MYTKRRNVKITKIVSDLRDAIVDLKKVKLELRERGESLTPGNYL